MQVIIVILIFHIKSKSRIFFENAAIIIQLLPEIWSPSLMYVTLCSDEKSRFASILNKINYMFLSLYPNIYMMHLFGEFMSFCYVRDHGLISIDSSELITDDLSIDRIGNILICLNIGQQFLSCIIKRSQITFDLFKRKFWCNISNILGVFNFIQSLKLYLLPLLRELGVVFIYFLNPLIFFDANSCYSQRCICDLVSYELLVSRLINFSQ